MAIRLLVVIGVRLYRDGIAAMLGARPSFDIVGTAATRSAAVAAARALRPDIALVDVAVPDAIDLIRDVRRDCERTAVVAFAIDELTSDVLRCAEAGAAGYVTSEASIDELAAGIEAALSGELKCSPRMAGELFRRLGKLQPARAGQSHVPLTARESEVLDYLRSGLSNKEIGRKLCLAESTVKHHVHHLLEKLDVRTRAQAAARSGGRELSARGRGDSLAV
jgi:two-component system, NarL family, nitrate/nitrite response regulator NarL